MRPSLLEAPKNTPKHNVSTFMYNTYQALFFMMILLIFYMIVKAKFQPRGILVYPDATCSVGFGDQDEVPLYDVSCHLL